MACVRFGLSQRCCPGSMYPVAAWVHVRAGPLLRVARLASHLRGREGRGEGRTRRPLRSPKCTRTAPSQAALPRAWRCRSLRSSGPRYPRLRCSLLHLLPGSGAQDSALPHFRSWWGKDEARSVRGDGPPPRARGCPCVCPEALDRIGTSDGLTACCYVWQGQPRWIPVVRWEEGRQKPRKSWA